MVHCHTSSKEKYTHTTDKWINIPGAWPAIPTKRRQDCVDEMIVLSTMYSESIPRNLVNTELKRKTDRLSRCSDYRDQLNSQFVILKIDSWLIFQRSSIMHSANLSHGCIPMACFLHCSTTFPLRQLKVLHLVWLIRSGNGCQLKLLYR